VEAPTFATKGCPPLYFPHFLSLFSFLYGFNEKNATRVGAMTVIATIIKSSNLFFIATNQGESKGDH